MFLRKCLSAPLSFLSDIASVIAGSLSAIRDATVITLLSLSLALAVLFVFWMHRQEKRGKPALIPNSLWKDVPFSTICAMVLMTWAVVQSMDWFLSLLYVSLWKISWEQTIAVLTDSF